MAIIKKSVTLVVQKFDKDGQPYVGNFDPKTEYISSSVMPEMNSLNKGLLTWKGYTGTLTKNTTLELYKGTTQSNNLMLAGDSIGDGLKPSTMYLIWGNFDFIIANLLGVGGTITIKPFVKNATIETDINIICTALSQSSNFSFIVYTNETGSPSIRFDIINLNGSVSLHDTSQIICQEQ